MDPKKPNLPLPSAGQIFLWLFKDEVCQNRKNPKIFVKNDQNPLLFVLVGKEIVCRLQKCCWILFPPMKVKTYNCKNPVFAEIYSFCRKRPIRNRFSKK